MNGAQPLNFESIDAVVLAALALFLIFMAYVWHLLLTWRADVIAGTGDTSFVRVESAAVIMKIIVLLHLMNVGMFLFVNSGWQALASWNNRLLPERANAVIMLLSYYIVIAICKLTWKDIRQQIHNFVHRTPPPPPNATAAQTAGQG